MPAAPDEIMALIAFARVAEAGSFTAAAAKLGVSKSVVSDRIAGLEDRLGTRLLQRTTRKLSLTPEGLALVEPCARLVATADEVAAAADGAGHHPRGLLRVDAPVVLAEDCLAEPIASFLEQHPDVRVEMTLNDRFIDLVEEGIDVAVRVTSRLAGAALVARKLASDETALVASPAYLARRGTPQDPQDLLRHDCLIYSLLKVPAEWRFQAPGGGRRELTIPVEARFKASSGAVLRRAALAGMGLAVMPTFMIASELAAGRLVRVVPAFVPTRLGVYAMYSQGKRVPAKTRAFVDHLVKAWKGFAPRKVDPGIVR
jgi:DNA-binding transcriptional LysR family regulator